jgi:glycosyltransferase involved in cell wall biosynthesis
MNPLVSIIIPTYNSAVILDECLKSIKEQSYKNIEIIVVDQSSDDQSRSIAEKFDAKVVLTDRPKYYSPPSISRNIGAKKAKGKIFYHIDSDMILSRKLIEEIVNIFHKDDKIVAAIIHEQDITRSFWGQAKALERKCYWGNDQIESARSVRAKIFQQLGGYDESISSGEDFLIQEKYKQIGKVVFCNNVVYHSISNFSFWKSIIKKYNYGKSAKYYFSKTKSTGFNVLLQYLSLERFT